MDHNGSDELGKEVVRPTASKFLRIFFILLTLEILFTCVYIEVLNQIAGGILPREVTRDGHPKWQIGYTVETHIAQMFEKEYRRENHLSPEASLPKGVAEDIATRAKIESRRASAENGLRGACATLGLLQYPAAFTVGMLGFIMGFRKPRNLRRDFCFCCGFIGVACLGIALYRSYFGSLGW